MPHHRHGQRGAALLIAMALMTLVATLAAGMIWQQYRAIQVETAERSRTQSAWILNGALDWARLILREDARNGGPTALTEPWATPLAEARLSTFLALDQDNNADSGPDAFLSGSIVDLQSRYNLRNLVVEGKVAEAELASLQRLCEVAGAPTDTAQRIANGFAAAASGAAGAPLAPQTIDELRWLGVDAAVIERLRPLIEILPVRTTVNINTAERDVIVAVSPGLDTGAAEALVQARQRRAFKDVEAARATLAKPQLLDPRRVGTQSSFFEVRGRLRLEDRTLEERSIVERRGLEMIPILRERVASVSPAHAQEAVTAPGR
ncbi:MAG: type II secretion system minor pseudopilin GspK [Burkholderiaceae bacterium]